MDKFSQSPTEPAFVQDPYPFYDKARAAGDLFWWTDYEMVMALSHRAVDRILRDRRFGRSVPAEDVQPNAAHLTDFQHVEENSMLELEPPSHTRLRSLVVRAFTTQRIQRLAPEISQLADAAIDRFPSEPFDLLTALARDLPVIVIARLLGLPDSMAPQLSRWSNDMVAMYQARRDLDIEHCANNAAREFSEFISEFIEIRRKRPGEDLISHLIAAEESRQKLSTDELVATCILLLNAGHEATVHMIGNAVRAILKTGMDRQALQPAFVEATIEELLRYDPPLHMFTRYAYEEVTLFDHTFKRGDKVGCLLAAANRDPAFFIDPHELDPTRPNAKHASFGAGLHFCIGAPLARLELQIVLPLLFSRCPNLSLVEEPYYADLFHFHGLSELIVKT